MTQPQKPSTSAVPAAPAKGGGLTIVLALVLVLQLAGVGALLGWWAMKQPSGAAQVATGPPQPAEVTPDPAPPLPALTLASAAAPATVATGDSPAERLAKLAESLQPRLAGLPIDGGAPARLIVLGSGQQTVEKIAEIPRHERWELQFPPGNNVESYARQLEYFHIELGLIGGSDQITYISGLADPTPKSRTGPAAAESRLYLVWQRGSMEEADEQIVSRAKLPLADRVVAHFCSADLEGQLAQLEEAAAKAASRTRIRKTVFGLRPNDFGGYRLQVLEQKGD